MFAKARTRRLSANDEGNAAVEFAMIAPLLFIMIIAIFSIGWIMHSISSVRFALEEAGRALLVDSDMTQGELSALVTSKLGLLANSNVVVNLVIDAPQDGIKMAHANAKIPISFVVPLLPHFSYTFDTSVSIPLIAP